MIGDGNGAQSVPRNHEDQPPQEIEAQEEEDNDNEEAIGNEGRSRQLRRR